VQWRAAQPDIFAHTVPPASAERSPDPYAKSLQTLLSEKLTLN
jgi:hypothetical protein